MVTIAVAAVAAGIAYVAGAFTPAIGRKIKAWFVKESTALKTDVKADATKAVSKL
jgi:hypothetical protein